MENKDFIINNGVLEKYLGHDNNLIIPDGVKEIAKGFLEWNQIKDLISVTFPSTLEVIGVYAFSASRIKRVALPKSMRVLEYKAFHECGSVEEIVLNEGLETIGEYAFCGTGCKKIVIPNSVKEIKQGAFCDSRNLEEVYIPNSVEIIEKDAFSICEKLVNVTIPTKFKNQLDDIFKENDPPKYEGRTKKINYKFI